MIYRKHGITVRWENRRRIEVTESGVAVEEGELFRCYPDLEKKKGEGQKENGAASSFALPLSPFPFPEAPYERLIVTEGYAEHEYGERTWSERTHRFHASLVHGRLRALVDAAGDVLPIAEALLRSEEAEREAPKRLRVARNVTAALLPHLPGVLQTGGGLDGYGEPIVESRGGPWPNVYRPSYRVRPVRMPLNVRLEHQRQEIDPELPCAIARLGPVEGNGARVLIVDRDRVYPSFVRVRNIVAVSNERTWYPYAAGSFGAEMVV
jgi:hypothetical protein